MCLCERIWSLGEHEGGMGIRSGSERPGAMVLLLPRLSVFFYPTEPLFPPQLPCNRQEIFSMPLVESQTRG